ncbi:MAG: DUF6029 family protein [Candidatus Kapabacteria bacterium]|nr:DUF6029 family protein [Candidatus Kapabacteria bacterium]
MKKYIILIIALTLSSYSQNILDNGRLSGNFQLDGQYIMKDNAIGVVDTLEKIRSNSFLNLNYSASNFSFGLRYEGYFNRMLGYDNQYNGSGIPYRFATYNSEQIDITVGNFYEQFGSGMIYRSYQDWALGIDNSTDGARFKYRPASGLQILGLIGKQRYYWDKSPGIIRGADISIDLNEFSSLFSGKTENSDSSHTASSADSDSWRVNLGFSALGKFQTDDQSYYNLPQNVASLSGRASVMASNFSIETEYAYKSQDPNKTNLYNFNTGNAFLTNLSYFTEGFSLTLGAHRTDNMDYRSARVVTGNMLTINFIPPATKQQIYRLATVYPFATQLNGELGSQLDITYKFSENSFLGGQHGTTVNFNCSILKGLDTSVIKTDTINKEIRTVTYKSPFFGISKKLFYEDLNLELSHKWNDDWKSTFFYSLQLYDRDVMEEQGKRTIGLVHSHIAVADIEYKINETNSIRTELQHLWSNQTLTSGLDSSDTKNGNWALLLMEYTISPHWFISFFDEYNYGNHFAEKQLHYYNGLIAYTFGTTRFMCGYGRQRAGKLCVGGVCRDVPAMNGLTLTISSSF